MKTTRAAAVLTFVAFASFAAPASLAQTNDSEEIAIGQSVDDVIMALGKPEGRMKIGGTEYFHYSRGVVTFDGGKVQSFKLIPTELARQQREERDRREAERLAAREAARKQRIEEGTAAKEGKLADEEFKNLPVEERLAYWEKFRIAYPEVSVGDELSALKQQAQQADAEKGKAEAATLGGKIRDLESQLTGLRSLRNLSQGALIETRKKMAQLSLQIDDLRAKQAGLKGGAPSTPAP